MPKPIPYYDLRPHLVTGSIILWKSPGLVPWFIRRWSTYSHASLVVRLHDEALRERVWLVEALASGLCFRHLSSRLSGYRGQAYALIPPVSPTEQNCIQDWAMTECGKGIGYDYGSLFRNIFGLVSMDASLYFCSEVCTYAHAVCERIKMPKHAPRPGGIPDIIPGNLFEIDHSLLVSESEDIKNICCA